MLAARVEPKNGSKENKKTGNFKPVVFDEFQTGVDTASSLRTFGTVPTSPANRELSQSLKCLGLRAVTPASKPRRTRCIASPMVSRTHGLPIPRPPHEAKSGHHDL